jgi:hypothetical protein
LSEGFTRYAECNMENYVFEFFLKYVRRMRSDLNWSKFLKKNPKKPFVLFVTPSDIVYVLALIKTGMAMMWDQARRLQENPTHGEKKAVPLFTKGENLKRESDKTVWIKDGLNYYYHTAEKNWKQVYNDKDEFLDLCNKWEQWEPEDKSWKNSIRTYWREEEVEKNDIREASFWIFVTNGNSGSLKTRVGRIPSGRTGGRRRWRKMILGRKIRWLNGRRQKIWGRLRRLMMSPNFF